MSGTTMHTVPERYGHVYGPCAVLGAAISFTPVFEGRVVPSGSSFIVTDYDSLWVEAGSHAGATAVVGLLVLFALVAMLLVATFRPPRIVALPIAIAVTAVLPLIMLATKFGASPGTELSVSGGLGLGMACFVLVTGIAHAVHLGVRRP